jgi:GTP pyrophosphokinase
VRAWFRRSAHESNLAAGRALLERELKRLALPDVDLAKLPAHFHLQTQDELLVGLALGEISPGQVARVLQESHLPQHDAPSAPLPAARPTVFDHSAITIEGVGNLLTVLAKCCQPLPGDPVRGFITRTKGVSVHRANCASLARLARRDPDRVIDVNWGQANAQAYEVTIQLNGYDRKGLQKDVVGLISNANISIIASNSRLFARTGEVEMRYTLRVRDFEQLSALLDRLAALPNVVEARRVGSG